MNDWKPVRANKLQGESFFPVHPCRADQVSSISCVPSLSPWRGRPAAPACYPGPPSPRPRHSPLPALPGTWGLVAIPQRRLRCGCNFWYQ